jgi:hypothetical protein
MFLGSLYSYGQTDGLNDFYQTLCRDAHKCIEVKIVNWVVIGSIDEAEHCNQCRPVLSAIINEQLHKRSENVICCAGNYTQTGHFGLIHAIFRWYFKKSGMEIIFLLFMNAHKCH